MRSRLVALAAASSSVKRRVDSTRPAGQAVALAFWGALEGAVITLAGQAPHDELLAARAAAGVLGLESPGVRPPT
jgi:hypothetical protein